MFIVERHIYTFEYMNICIILFLNEKSQIEESPNAKNQEPSITYLYKCTHLTGYFSELVSTKKKYDFSRLICPYNMLQLCHIGQHIWHVLGAHVLRYHFLLHVKVYLNQHETKKKCNRILLYHRNKLKNWKKLNSRYFLKVFY